MSNRRTYLAHELRAGHTVFIVTRAFVDHATGEGRYEVAEHLVASKGEPQPEPGQLPFRMHPDMARWAASKTDLWHTRRDAKREAARRQALEDAHFAAKRKA